MADGTWYYARGGQQLGPVSADEVKSKLSSGELSGQDLVWQEGMGNWQPAANVQEFAGLAPGQSASPAQDPAQGGYNVAPGYAPPAGGEYGTPAGYGAPQGYGQPGYGQPGYGAPGQPLNYGGYYPSGGYQAPAGPPPPNHLVGAILVTIFCCVIGGIVSIVYAAQVNSKWQAGDYAGAMEASKKANTWLWWSFGIGIVTTGGSILLQIAANS